MPPSRAQQKTFCGDEDRTRFRLRARAHDGHIVWTGWFEDRDDADAFLFALASGSLRHERALWRLPVPEWHPGISPDLAYEFATQTILTTTGSNQTYTSPSDWNNSDNTIECLGGGGAGALRGDAGPASGGGAGAYSAIANFSFATPGTTTATYRVGSGVAANTSSPSSGGAGGVTYFNASADPGNGSDNSKCSADNGNGGGTSTNSGGAGGLTTASWGQTKYAGGRGGNMSTSGSRGGSGGGGAAGPSGAGGDGVDGTSGSTAGGTANNGTTSGGTAPGGAGNAGTEFSASYGCGSGGGGRASASSGTAGNGGNYGSGGGGCASNSTPRQGGAGRQGLIVIEYTPPVSARFGNMPMLGM